MKRTEWIIVVVCWTLPWLCWALRRWLTVVDKSYRRGLQDGYKAGLRAADNWWMEIEREIGPDPADCGRGPIPSGHSPETKG